jgi:hypothetical protein
MNGPMRKIVPYLVGSETVIVFEAAAIAPNGVLVLIKEEIARFPKDRRGCIDAVISAVSAGLKIE